MVEDHGIFTLQQYERCGGAVSHTNTHTYILYIALNGIFTTTVVVRPCACVSRVVACLDSNPSIRSTNDVGYHDRRALIATRHPQVRGGPTPKIMLHQKHERNERRRLGQQKQEQQQQQPTPVNTMYAKAVGVGGDGGLTRCLSLTLFSAARLVLCLIALIQTFHGAGHRSPLEI